jgi:hypothetical protein
MTSTTLQRRDFLKWAVIAGTMLILTQCDDDSSSGGGDWNEGWEKDWESTKEEEHAKWNKQHPDHPAD